MMLIRCVLGAVVVTLVHGCGCSGECAPWAFSPLQWRPAIVAMASVILSSIET